MIIIHPMVLGTSNAVAPGRTVETKSELDAIKFAPIGTKIWIKGESDVDYYQLKHTNFKRGGTSLKKRIARIHELTQAVTMTSIYALTRTWRNR